MIYKTFNGMTWPCPGEEMDEIEWRLRYTNPSNVVAASIIASYRHLISLPITNREKIIKEIKMGVRG